MFVTDGGVKETPLFYIPASDNATMGSACAELSLTTIYSWKMVRRVLTFLTCLVRFSC